MPSSPRAYGPGFSLELTPFNRETMATFVFIERPEAQETEFTQGENTSLPSLSAGNFSDIFSSERRYHRDAGAAAGRGGAMTTDVPQRRYLTAYRRDCC